MRHVHPDLVGAAGLELTGDQRGYRLAVLVGAIGLQKAPMRDRLLAALVVQHRHPLSLRRVAADGRIDRPALAIRGAPDKRAVFPEERQGAAMVGEKRGKAAMRPIGLGDDQQAGRVLVEPVDDAGPPDAADAR